MMKHLFVAVFLLFAAGNLSAQGINFYKGTWSEALTEAKAKNKLIFVDAYASWCGPCKWMAKNVFTDAAVGEFYNKNFINLKIDMEKPENAEFAKKYPVQGYPTLYFINAQGKVVNKNLGGMEAADFINLGKKVI